MNMQYKQKTAPAKGFTIIEVVLVLAIAGLIFLMVFIALPALQKGQRDAQRKSDISRIATQIANYSTAVRGNIPTDMGVFTKGYLGGSGGTASTGTAGTEYVDPATGSGYKMNSVSSPPNTTANPPYGTIYYILNAKCSDTTPGTVVPGGGNRFYAMLTWLEGQTALYCIDNR